MKILWRIATPISDKMHLSEKPGDEINSSEEAFKRLE